MYLFFFVIFKASANIDKISKMNIYSDLSSFPKKTR